MLLGVPLGSLNFLFFRIDVLDVLTCSTKSGITGITPVDFKDVATGNIRLLLVLFEHSFDVYAVGIAADFFHQRIDPVVIRTGERSSAGVLVSLDKSGAWCLSTDLAA